MPEIDQKLVPYLEKLKKLLPAQFAEVVALYGFDVAHFSDNAAQTQKAILLLQHASQSVSQTKRLIMLLDKFFPKDSGFEQERNHSISSFLRKIQRTAEKRDENTDTKISAHVQPFPHLHVVCERHGIIDEYPIGVAEHGLDAKTLNAFIDKVLQSYREDDPRLISQLVYRGDVLDEAVRVRAKQERICLFSLAEYQGLINFDAYLHKQTADLEQDPIYPPALYVEQRIRSDRGKPATEQPALATVKDWLQDTEARFVLILGDFGTGKTFLLREVARRLGQEKNAVIPLLLEMRHLEKSKSLDILVAQQLAARDMGYRPAQFRYMLEQGRVALLFDGYDELALRVNYDKALEHFDTLLAAAQGEYAKVVVTSRTQHFISDKQVKLRLMDKAEMINSRKIVFLQQFDKEQIFAFLRNFLGNQADAEQRLRLLEEVPDLMGLSANPRMLSFIAELPEDDLRAAQTREGDITATKLYEMLLERWLSGKHKQTSKSFLEEEINKVGLAICALKEGFFKFSREKQVVLEEDENTTTNLPLTTLTSIVAINLLEYLTVLNNLLPAQFNQVVFVCNIPVEHLRPGAQAERAMDVIRYLEGRNQLDLLQKAIEMFEK